MLCKSSQFNVYKVSEKISQKDGHSIQSEMPIRSNFDRHFAFTNKNKDRILTDFALPFLCHGVLRNARSFFRKWFVDIGIIDRLAIFLKRLEDAAVFFSQDLFSRPRPVYILYRADKTSSITIDILYFKF